MRFNGWVRLWIVGAVIYGGVVANYAYREWPMLEQLQYNWIRDASEKMATAITANEVVSISLEKLSAHWFDDRTYTDAILELEQIEKSPTINQRIFSAKIKNVNMTHRAIIADLSEYRQKWLLKALLWWLGPSILLLALGLCVIWIVKGFRLAPTVK